jgi:DNA-binding CsgD family transcriptional regulator
MMPSSSSLNNLLSPLRRDYTARKLDRLQADLVATARTWAVDEMGAAMAHQLNEPLTALLLYLHEIKAGGPGPTNTESAPNSMQNLVEMALRETERVCEIIERLGHTIEAPVSEEFSIARGREAIESWTRTGKKNGGAEESSVPPRFSQNILTPREREVLALITEGASNKVGGPILGISKRTFEVHRAHIMGKLGAKNAADLVRLSMSEAR